MPVATTVEMLLRLMYGSFLCPAPANAVTEYSIFSFSLNEFGSGPIGLAVAAMVCIIPLVCLGCCVHYCCCSCSKLLCCKKSKELKDPETPEQKAGWRRCFFPKKKPAPTLPILMQDVDTYEPVYSGSLSIYSGTGSTRSGRTYSSRSRSRRRLPTLPEEGSSAYSNQTYGASPSAPQISEVPVYDSGSTMSV